MLLMVDLVGFDPAVGAGRFSPLGPLGTADDLFSPSTDLADTSLPDKVTRRPQRARDLLGLLRLH